MPGDGASSVCLSSLSGKLLCLPSWRLWLCCGFCKKTTCLSAHVRQRGSAVLCITPALSLSGGPAVFTERLRGLLRTGSFPLAFQSMEKIQYGFIWALSYWKRSLKAMGIGRMPLLLKFLNLEPSFPIKWANLSAWRCWRARCITV